MAFPPEAFIIGAQKAGTTSLATMLDAQPGITLSQPKETQFFSLNWPKGVQWYRERFAGAEHSVFLDASTDCAAAPTTAFPTEVHPNDPRRLVPKRIHSLNPNARFLYILREPAARVYSAYWHAVRAGFVKRSFREAIEKNPSFLRTSDYAGQIRNYLEFFDLEDMLLLSFEGFTRDPEATLEKCCAFLGVTFEGLPGNGEDGQKNKSYQLSPVAKMVRALAGSNDSFKTLARGMRSIVPKSLANVAMNVMTQKIPPIEDSDRLYLYEIFKERNLDLQALTGFDISAWE